MKTDVWAPAGVMAVGVAAPPADATGWRRLILHALGERRRLRDIKAGVVIANLSGGPAALLPTRTQACLVTRLDSLGASHDRWSVRTWLERHQARRSALLVATDRPTAVAHALRMNLDLSRIRIEQDQGSSTALIRLVREVESASTRARAWHSAGR